MPLLGAAAPSLETPAPTPAHAPHLDAAEYARRLPPLRRPTARDCAAATRPGAAVPQAPRVLQHRDALLIQCLDLLIACLPPLSGGLAGRLLPKRRQSQRADRCGRRCGRTVIDCRLWQLGQVSMQAAEHPFKCFAMVLENVPPISHLERCRCSIRSPTGILGPAVTGDHLDARMITQPGCECVGGAIGQEIER